MDVKIIDSEEFEDTPNIVYKYRSWTDEHHKEIISEQIIFMANPLSFSDSLDCKLQKRYDLMTFDEIFKKCLEREKVKYPNHTQLENESNAYLEAKNSNINDSEFVKRKQREHLEESMKRQGVLSLTFNSKIDKMWEEYSDNHRGFCIGFDTKKISNLGGRGSVIYVDKLPDILYDDSYEVEFFKQIFHKENKYSFEEEFRVRTFRESQLTNDQRRIKLPKDYYKEIIFGAKMSERHKNEIIDVCNRQGLEIDFYSALIFGNQIVHRKH